MSLHKVYCSVCYKYVEINLAGHIYEFIDWPIHCPCVDDESVVIKKMFDNDYGLFNICDLVSSKDILQETTIIKAQLKA